MQYMQVVAQLNAFLLAAFETTTATIAFCIYFIAQHPAVEARLVQELQQAAPSNVPGLTADSAGQQSGISQVSLL